MANYSIVSNARFTPFTFEQMVKPFEMYGEYYNQQEQLASALAEQAAEWGQKANEATDPETYARYSKYEKDLKAKTDQLLRHGMTPGLRRDLQVMRQRYAKEINPIKDAYAWRLQQIQNQAEGKLKGVVYEDDAATTSLDKYLNNPTLIYSAADSNAGYTRLANAAQSIAKGLADAKITGKFDSMTNKLLQTAGYNTDNVQEAIAQAQYDLEGVINGSVSLNSNNPAAKVVQQLLQNEAAASGTDEWQNAGARNEYIQKVMPALYNLIGPSSVTPMANTPAIQAEQRQAARESQDHGFDISRKSALFSANLGLAGTGLKLVEDNGIVSYVNTVTGKTATPEQVRQAKLAAGLSPSPNNNPGRKNNTYGTWDKNNSRVVFEDGTIIDIDNVNAIDALDNLTANGEKVQITQNNATGVMTIKTQHGTKEAINLTAAGLTKNDIGEAGKNLMNLLMADQIYEGDFENNMLTDELELSNNPTIEDRDQTIGDLNSASNTRRAKTRLEAGQKDTRKLTEAEAKQFITANKYRLKVKGKDFSTLTTDQIDKLVQNIDIIVTHRSGIIDNEWAIIKKGKVDEWKSNSDDAYWEAISNNDLDITNND